MLFRSPKTVQAKNDEGERLQRDLKYKKEQADADFAKRYQDVVSPISQDIGKALDQFAYSLKRDAKHAKTLLNQGIVLAFGKQDLEGAAKSWEEVMKVAPDSQEAQGAKRALDSLRAAHPGAGTSQKPGP